ncbi:hypothetical protein ACHAQJ_007177 [Trichoderma viride]
MAQEMRARDRFLMHYEIEKLKLRIQDLEAELKRCKSHGTTASASTLLLSTKAFEATGAAACSTQLPSRLPPRARNSKGGWTGVFIPSPRSEQTSYYGACSTFYFLSRIGTYLGTAVEQSITDHSLYPKGVSATLANLASLSENEGPRSHASIVPVPRLYLTRAQEEHFLQLFWESHYCMLPIIDDVAFMAHYSSLWVTGQSYRTPSALVDIVLALCMQYGWAFFAGNNPSIATSDASNNATIAGQWYFRRCQSLLAINLESPSITTVQCKIYSIIYLCCASFWNTAHTTLAETSRIAQLLGLHLEPPDDMLFRDRELRKLIWSVLYTLETRMSLKLGRPSAIDSSQTTVTRPSEDIAPGLLDSWDAYAQNVTWITFTNESENLINTAKQIYDRLKESGDTIFEQRQLQGSPYQDPQTLEVYAKAVVEQVPALQAWLDSLPAGIKTQRKGNGKPFSVDRSAVDIDVLAPLWLQRQRLYLELMYHGQMMNFYRPFITFNSTDIPLTYSPITKQLALASVSHAIAHTGIVHQVITGTDIMNGWQEFFQWQWSATLVIIGFILANPIHASTPVARRVLDKGITVFEILGRSYPMAARAETVSRDLAAKADILSIRLQDAMISRPGGVGVESGSGFEFTEIDSRSNPGTAMPQQALSEYVDQFMDWALTVESYNNAELFFANIS